MTDKEDGHFSFHDNPFTQALTRLGERLEKPKGLDERLFRIAYEPGGCPGIAKDVIETVPNNRIQETEAMGLDHGAWTVLKHLYPKADVPVFQLSLDSGLSTGSHFLLASELKRMRKRGVLIIGSGNVVHNLRTVDWNNIDAKALDWAVESDEMGFPSLGQLSIIRRYFTSGAPDPRALSADAVCVGSCGRK